MRYHLSHLVTASLGEHTTIQVQKEALTLDKDLSVDFLRGELLFTRVNRGIYVQGRLQTQIQMTCVRCLEPLSYPFDIEITEQYLFYRQEGDEEPIYFVATDGTIDITEPVRQQIWVNQPLHPLCHPDCQGLCPHCGANLNRETCNCQQKVIDPRLALLEELL